MTADTFTCPGCGRTSHNPTDARYDYCGACSTFWKRIGAGVWSNELGELHCHLGQMLEANGYEDNPRNRAMLELASADLAEQLGIELRIQ